MLVYHTKGTNEVSIGLTAKKLQPDIDENTGREKKQNSKVGQLLSYDKREMKSILKRFKRKGENLRSVVISYTWGFLSKEPHISYSRVKYPLDERFSLDRLINFALSDMKEKYDNYKEKGSDEKIEPGHTKPLPYYLREISFYFISDKEKRPFTANEPKEKPTENIGEFEI